MISIITYQPNNLYKLLYGEHTRKASPMLEDETESSRGSLSMTLLTKPKKDRGVNDNISQVHRHTCLIK